MRFKGFNDGVSDAYLLRVDKFLDNAIDLMLYAERLYFRCIELRTTLESAGAIDYERMGKLGCKVSGGGGYDTGSRVLDLLELEESYQDILEDIEWRKGDIKKIIYECPDLTDLQKQVMWLRHSDLRQDGFNEVARLAGLKNYDAAWWQYKTGYVRFVDWIAQTDYLDNFAA